MDKKIILTDKYFIARGGERDCYLHPLDYKKVIKIVHGYSDILNRNQNDLDYKYFKFLEKLKIPYSHIIRCYGYIDTNLGKGLIFDKVFDYNGNISMSFLDAMMQNKFTQEAEYKLINDLKNYLFKNNVIFVDIGLYNILACEYQEDKYKLIIVDGLGGRRPGIRFWLYLNSKLFTKYKIRKSWKRFINELNKVKKIKFKDGLIE